MNLLIAAIAMIAVSGLPGALMNRRRSSGQFLAAMISTAGSICGLLAVGQWLAVGGQSDLRIAWSLVPGADFHVGLDGLSAAFLLPIFVIPALGSIYGLGYWRQSEHADNGRKLRLFYGLCAAGMAVLVVARNSVVFLFGWEVMALSAFVLVATEDDQPSVAEAGWVYLVATHAATLTLFGLFAALAALLGAFDLPADGGKLSPAAANAAFLLALVGFGFKAGIMPLHVWLPGAHANAPSHVSALMSGVLIKMGVYGLLRVFSFLPDPPLWWGGLLLALGVVSGVIGLAFAAAQRDFKRLLAYSSIENIGIISIATGLALLGRTTHRADWVVLGVGGAVWHVWNHALFKSLLFFCAGSVLHATETRDINQLGGLAKRTPLTAFCFLLGAVAVCGLPPLNGFVSEFLIYVGLFGTLGIPDGAGPSLPGAALAAPGLAFIGALAVACYATAFAGIFLGAPRSSRVEHAHEANWAMLVPMLLLVGCCVFVGLAPGVIAPALDPAIAAWTSAAPDGAALAAELKPLTEQVPLGWLSALGLALVALAAFGGAALAARLRPRFTSSSVTWGCGYLAPSARMQYTSTSFSEILTGLFRWALRPQIRRPRIDELFPHSASFETAVPDSVLESVVRPALRSLGQRILWFRVFQQGNVRVYLFYLFAALLLLLIWPY
ncbi:MAG TPA: proton-conducting transporter membrane subunit [Pirellulales bacterium]|nr:proton-conducting transporter membrane subunit [Pirellulales bacterium]